MKNFWLGFKKLFRNISTLAYIALAITPVIWAHINFNYFDTTAFNDITNNPNEIVLKVLAPLLTIAFFIFAFIRGFLNFEWFKRRDTIKEKVEQAIVENNLTFKTLTDIEGELKEIKQYLPLITCTDDYIDFEARGYSLSDFESMKGRLQGSLNRTITAIENPIINHSIQYGIIRLWMKEIPNFIKYANAPKRKGYINFGMSSRGWVWMKITDIFHFLVYAMTRKGKSVMIGSMLAQIFIDPEATALFIDYKAGETALSYRDIPNIAISTNIGDVTKFNSYKSTIRGLEAIYEIMVKRHEINARMSEQGKTPRFSPLWVVLDEASFFFAGWQNKSGVLQQRCVTIMTAIAQMGASANVHLIIGTQKPSIANLPDQIRTNTEDVIGGKTGDGNTSKLLMETEVLYRMNSRAGYMCKKDSSNNKIFMQTLFVNMKKGEGAKIIKRYGERELTKEYKFIMFAINNPEKWQLRKKNLKKKQKEVMA